MKLNFNNTRKLLLFFFGFMLVFLSLLNKGKRDYYDQSLEPEVQSWETAQNQERFRVTRVIDGDSIKLDRKIELRYIGIDAPELVENNVATCLGIKARIRNTELVSGKQVMLEKDVSEMDQYGRLLRYVWLGDELINQTLVEEGLAQAKVFPPDSKYRDRLIEAQARAQENEAGMWGDLCRD